MYLQHQLWRIPNLAVKINSKPLYTRVRSQQASSMDTLNTSKQRSHQLEEFLDSLEQEEAADDVPEEEIEAGAAAYQAYKEGRDPGKSLEQLKAELGC